MRKIFQFFFRRVLFQNGMLLQLGPNPDDDAVRAGGQWKFNYRLDSKDRLSELVYVLGLLVWQRQVNPLNCLMPEETNVQSLTTKVSPRTVDSSQKRTGVGLQ